MRPATVARQYTGQTAFLVHTAHQKNQNVIARFFPLLPVPLVRVQTSRQKRIVPAERGR